MNPVIPATRYDYAMQIADQGEADLYLEFLIAVCMAAGRSQMEATEIERSNLAYWAAYFGNETRARVERLFRCEHPYFGSIERNGPPTAEQAFEAGKKMAEAARGEKL